MTRDMDLVRDILLRLERLPTTMDEFVMVPIDSAVFEGLGASRADIGYHVKLLIDHGFIKSRSKNHPSIGFLFGGLSWSGHDFVDSVRRDDIWQKTKTSAPVAGPRASDRPCKGDHQERIGQVRRWPLAVLVSDNRPHEH